MVGIEKWRDEKLLCLVEKKNERTIHVVHINLLLCPYYIKKMVYNFFFLIITNLQTNATSKTFINDRIQDLGFRGYQSLKHVMHETITIFVLNFFCLFNKEFGTSSNHTTKTSISRTCFIQPCFVILTILSACMKIYMIILISE